MYCFEIEESIGVTEGKYLEPDIWGLGFFAFVFQKTGNFMIAVQFNSVQLLSRVRLFATRWIAARQASLSITNSQSLLRLMSIESGMPFSHLILCRPLLLLPPIPPSIRVFSSESALCMRWSKYWRKLQYWCFSISHSSSQSQTLILGLISNH